MEFCRELLAPGREILWKNGILPGTTGLWMRNPPEEWNFAGNYQLLDEESTGGMEFCWNYWFKDMDSDRQAQKSSDQ
jgi:hypothetical protein